MSKSRKFFVGVAIVVVILASSVGGAIADRLFGIKPLDLLVGERNGFRLPGAVVEQKVLREESVVIDIAERVSPSVVTIAVQTPKRRVLDLSPFGGFGFREEGGGDQDIATGFILTADGLIATNKHVVQNTSAAYKVITKDGKEYPVREINRDPSNDLAILKIDPSPPAGGSGQVLKAVELGDSGNLKVGQFVIAIGTALGEFRHTVTTGVISGLGRGIVAGSPFEGFVERLDDVIQTDAAINPGNSGGPLLNSAGQVIGVNVAVAQGAQNVGFAIPINIVKDSLNQFKATGKFASRPFLGVQYQMISRETAILNDVPQGAYVLDVVNGSPAQKAGVGIGDVITKMDGVEIKDEEGGLADIIKKKKVGDSVTIEIWRDGKTLSLSTTLTEFTE